MNSLLAEMGANLRLTTFHTRGVGVHWKDPYLRKIVESRLRMEVHIDYRFPSNAPAIRRNTASVSSPPILELHPHDYMWIVSEYDIPTASRLVMQDIERRIEESADAAIAKLERMNKGEKESIFSTRLYQR